MSESWAWRAPVARELTVLLMGLAVALVGLPWLVMNVVPALI
jgi:hypothetical protein